MPDLHEKYMLKALELAREASDRGEVPVGALIVKDGEIIGRGSNRREELQSSISHAEVEAISQANKHLNSWRLEGCQMYVTLEPCPMCAGALLQSRISHVIYGATDPKAGAADTLYKLFEDKRLNHQVQVTSGVLANESSELLKQFFKRLR